MTDATLSKKAKQIQEIYDKFTADLLNLKKKQSTLVESFVKELESKKIKKIRKVLGLK